MVAIAAGSSSGGGLHAPIAWARMSGAEIGGGRGQGVLQRTPCTTRTTQERARHRILHRSARRRFRLRLASSPSSAATNLPWLRRRTICDACTESASHREKWASRRGPRPVYFVSALSTRENIATTTMAQPPTSRTAETKGCEHESVSSTAASRCATWPEALWRYKA
eukprot:scaffold153720_cov31-Tisochrysis_lutea.AAC.2